MGEHFDSEPDPEIQARVAQIKAEFAAGLRAHPVKSSSPASSAGEPSDQHIREALDPDERAQWVTLSAADRKRLTREFRGDPITPAGRSYLAKKIALLAPGAPDQAKAQPAASERGEPCPVSK